MNALDNYVMNKFTFDIKDINAEKIIYTTNDLIKKIKFMHQNISNIMLLNSDIDDYKILMGCNVLYVKDANKKNEMDEHLKEEKTNKMIFKDLAHVEITSDYFYAGHSGTFSKRDSNLFNYNIEGIVDYKKFILELEKMEMECRGFLGVFNKDDFENFASSILKGYHLYCLEDKQKSKQKVLERK